MSNNYINNSNNSNELDPEIADLIGLTGDQDNEESPDFFDLFEDEKTEPAGPEETEEVFSESFFTIKEFSENAKPYFTDPAYYKKLLSGEGEISKRVHSVLSDFLKAESPKERTLFRERLITAYWELAISIAAKVSPEMPTPAKLLLRYGILLPTLINKEQRALLSTIIEENNTGEPIHYVDEWLIKIASGDINPSAADETKNMKQKHGSKTKAMLEKAKGQKDASLNQLKTKTSTVTEIENAMMQKIAVLQKYKIDQKTGLRGTYNQIQKNAISEMMELSRKLCNYDREIAVITQNHESNVSKVEELQRKIAEEGGDSTVDRQTITDEFMAVKQMAKMSVGRKGNHFPILMQQYMRSNIRDIATRENIISMMSEIEKIDPGLFKRTFKRQTNRIVPYVIIVPSYGEFGICWEPYEKFNRASSRGRIAIPLYPKDLKTAVLYALADLRWQVAKETASYYWMEEGLTGKYYQWFTDQKMRGDVKEYFIRDYILWITKESDGMQKLDREVRGVFWRNIPFPQTIKDILRNRGFVYNELYKKDINIQMSDGY